MKGFSPGAGRGVLPKKLSGEGGGVLPEVTYFPVSYGSSFFPFDLWPARFAFGPQIDGEKTRSVTYSTALELG